MKFSKIIAVGLPFAAAFFAACGDDSSTQAPGNTQQVGTEVIDPNGMATPDVGGNVGGNNSSTQSNETSDQGSTNHSASGEVSYGTLVDERDGQTYKTVTIGTLTWMAENLNYDPGDVSSMGTYGWSGCYNNESANCSKYGRLYTWNAAMDACPSGWFLPGKYSMASIKTDLVWNFDSIDYSHHFAGGYCDGGEFKDLGVNVRLWSSTEYNDFFAFSLFGGSGLVEDSPEDKSFAFSVRCVTEAITPRQGLAKQSL